MDGVLGNAIYKVLFVMALDIVEAPHFMTNVCLRFGVSSKYMEV
jgi:hypothetical protein